MNDDGTPSDDGEGEDVMIVSSRRLLMQALPLARPLMFRLGSRIA
jgi:hypothetical protein